MSFAAEVSGSESTFDLRAVASGPIGLLAALIGKRRGLDVHVLDRVDSGLKPDLVRALRATHHAGTVAGIGFRPDIIIESDRLRTGRLRLHTGRRGRRHHLSYRHRQQ